MEHADSGAGFKTLLDTPPAWLPHVVLIVCQAAFAIMQVVAPFVLATIPPWAFASLRVCGAVPLLFGVARHAERGRLLFPPRTLAIFAFLGVTGVYLPQGLIFWGLALVGPEVVAITQPTIPVYVALLSAACGLETLTPVKIAGILLAVTGAAVDLDVFHVDFGSTKTSGMLVMLLQTVSYAVFIVSLSQVIVQRPRPLTIFAWASAAGAVCLAATALPQFAAMDVRAVPAIAWAVLAYSSVGVSFGAHGSVSWAVRHISPTIPSLYACLQPLFVTALSAALERSGMRTMDWIAMLLVLSGLAATVLAKHRETGRTRALVAVGSRAVELVGCSERSPATVGVTHVAREPVVDEGSATQGTRHVAVSACGASSSEKSFSESSSVDAGAGADADESKTVEATERAALLPQHFHSA